MYSAHSLKGGSCIEKNILFLHAFSGCDTTSALFQQGKLKFLTVLGKNEPLSEVIEIFKNPTANPDDVGNAGERFLLSLYGCKRNADNTLDNYRYERFLSLIQKSRSNIATMPPTSAAARQHSLRTYYQVQLWYGVQKNAEEWGWKMTNTGLTPLTTLKDPAPQALLKFISCKCKTGCGAACGCRKAGLHCSVICSFCEGKNCANKLEEIVDVDEEDQMPPSLEIFHSNADTELDPEDADTQSDTATAANTQYQIDEFRPSISTTMNLRSN